MWGGLEHIAAIFFYSVFMHKSVLPKQFSCKYLKKIITPPPIFWWAFIAWTSLQMLRPATMLCYYLRTTCSGMLHTSFGMVQTCYGTRQTCGTLQTCYGVLQTYSGMLQTCYECWRATDNVVEIECIGIRH